MAVVVRSAAVRGIAISPTPACDPVRRRDLFLAGPGPDSNGSKAFRDGWAHSLEKSGIDAVR